MYMKKFQNIFKGYLFIITNLCLIILLGFGLLNFSKENTTVALVEFGLGFLLLVSSISMIITKKEIIATSIALLVIILLSINNVVTGGFFNTGIFWIYILPVVTFFITNIKKASLISFSFIIFMFVIATLQLQKIIILPYTSITLYFSTLSLLLTTILTIVYKRINDLNFERIENLLTQQELFSSILKLNSSYRNLRTFADQVMSIIVNYFKIDAGLLQLHSPGDDYLKAVGGYKVTTELLSKIEKYSLKDATYTDVLKDLKPMYLIDFDEVDPIRYKMTKRKTVVMVPLINRGKLTGAISLGSNKRRVFTDSDKKIIERIAKEVSLIIENVKKEEIIVEKLV